VVYLAATTMATVKAANATNKTLWPQRPTYPIILISSCKRFNLVREQNHIAPLWRLAPK
jgi:hypothetical protein